jgi:hypothetical protein
MVANQQNIETEILKAGRGFGLGGLRLHPGKAYTEPKSFAHQATSR